MCRMFYNPDPALKYKQDDIFAFFAELERVGGKDGNGVFLMKNEQLEKSAFMMPIWVEIRGEFVFHTRFKTTGKVADYNTQPFEGKRYVVCHNGVFNRIKDIGILFGVHQDKYSDSYVIHKAIEKVGILKFYATFADSYYGVILAYDKKEKLMYLLKTGGQFQFCELLGSYIYGSSNLDFWKDTTPTKQFLTGLYILKKDGPKKIHIPKKKYNYYSNQYNYYDDYDFYGGRGGKGWNYGRGKRKKKNWSKNKTVKTPIKPKQLPNRKPKEIDVKSLFPVTHLCPTCDLYEKKENRCLVNDSEICATVIQCPDYVPLNDEPIGIGALFPEDNDAASTNIKLRQEVKKFNQPDVKSFFDRYHD